MQERERSSFCRIRRRRKTSSVRRRRRRIRTLNNWKGKPMSITDRCPHCGKNLYLSDRCQCRIPFKRATIIGRIPSVVEVNLPGRAPNQLLGDSVGFIARLYWRNQLVRLSRTFHFLADQADQLLTSMDKRLSDPTCRECGFIVCGCVGVDPYLPRPDIFRKQRAREIEEAAAVLSHPDSNWEERHQARQIIESNR